MNMAVLALERGVVKGLASGMREAAAGDWAIVLPEKDVNLILKGRAKVMINKALTYAECLAFLAIDSRCVSHILREFPDVAKIATAVFLVRPDRLGNYTSHFQKQAKRAIIRLLNSMMPTSPSCTKKVAEDTAFLKEVVKHARSIGETFERDDADECAASSTIIINALRIEAADMQALRGDLYKVAEDILSGSMGSDHVDLGIKLLSLTLENDCSETLPSEYPSLGSSLLALLFAVNIPKETQFYAHFAKKRFWIHDLRSLPEIAEYELLFSRFKADKKALSRAVQVSKLFSNPSKDLFDIGCIETPKLRRTREQAGVLDLAPPAARMLPHLRCRKCSQPGCEKVESVAGTFQVCGRCKIAVYCSKDCQKRAWKEGHKTVCH